MTASSGPSLVQQGVSLALEAHARGLLPADGLDLILAYYDGEGAAAPLAPDEVLSVLGKLSPAAIASVRPQANDEGERQAFSERLDLLELLGEGGMGAVYRAYDKSLQRVVALKLIRPDRLRGENAERRLARFRREAQVMARVRHPACVQVFDYGLGPDDQPYLVQQYVEGQSLAARIQEAGPADPRLVARWGQSLAEGLHACHLVGVVHRDVKPDNVLIDLQGNPRLTDFGVAQDTNAETKLTLQASAVGTLAYMPPEQAAGEVASPRSDVYALGATLFQALAGQPPFSSSQPLVLMAEIASQPPPRLSRLRPDVPADLEAVVLKCLEKDPGERYQDAQALAQDLSLFLAGEPVAAQAAGPLGRVRRRLWRRRRVLLGAVCALLLAGAGGVLWAVERSRRDYRRTRDAIDQAASLDDLDAAQEALLPLLDSPHPDLAGAARRSLDLVRGRGYLQQARGAHQRYVALLDRKQAALALEIELDRRVDPGVPVSDSPDKQHLLALRLEITALGHELTVAFANAERLFDQAGVFLAQEEVDPDRGLLYRDHGRALEPEDPAAAEVYLARAARCTDELAEELHLPALEVDCEVRAEYALERYEFDPTLGHQVPREVQRGRTPVTLELAPGDYRVRIRARGFLELLQPLLARRGQARSISFESPPALDSIGALSDLVVFVAPGAARWKREFSQVEELEGFLLRTTEVTLEEWLSFVRVNDLSDSYTPISYLVSSSAVRFPVGGVLRDEVAEYLHWLQQELNLASLRFSVSLPSLAESHRALRGELSWRYPWGNTWDPSFASTGETLSGGGLTVGSRLADCSPFGARDLIGSMTEFTLDTVQRGQSGTRVAVFGSSFTATGDSVRSNCLAFSWGWADHELAEVGFRYVLRPTDGALLPTDPPNPQAFEAGMRLARQGRRHEAYQALTAFLRGDPTNVAGWLERGLVRMELEDFWGAWWDYSRATQLAPDDPTGWWRRGYALAGRQLWAEAVADFTHALALSPDQPEALLGRGLYRIEAELPGAEEDLVRFLELAPGHRRAPWARQRLAQLRAGGD
jgi:tRNA A-37 threonylcarbamoyl transferase component Bud32